MQRSFDDAYMLLAPPFETRCGEVFRLPRPAHVTKSLSVMTALIETTRPSLPTYALIRYQFYVLQTAVNADLEASSDVFTNTHLEFADWNGPSFSCRLNAKSTAARLSRRFHSQM